MKHYFLFVLLCLCFINQAVAAGPKPADEPNSPSLTNLPYDDKDFSCTTEADADRYVRDFNIDQRSFGGKELCNASIDSKKLFNDLDLIEHSAFEARLDHSFIRGFVDRNSYYSWLKGETYGVRRGHDIPYATAYNSGGYFTMQDGWAKLSTLGRVGTIIHEARHTEGYRHYGCNHGPYKNSSVSGCDTSYSQGGSHGVEMEYYARVVIESKNLHPVYQSMARLMAIGRSNHVFNQSPVVKREAIALSTPTEMVLFDKNILTKRELPRVDNTWKLKRTSAGASFFKSFQAISVDLYSSFISNVNMQDDYSYFKLLFMPRDNAPTQIVDAEEYDINTYRYYVAMNPNGRLSSYYFSAGEWYPATREVPGALKLTPTAPNGEQGLFLVTQDGSILPFDGANRRLGSPLNTRWNFTIEAYAKDAANNVLLALTNDGRVVSMPNQMPVPELEGRSYNGMVNVPMYDAFEVAP